MGNCTAPHHENKRSELQEQAAQACFAENSSLPRYTVAMKSTTQQPTTPHPPHEHTQIQNPALIPSKCSNAITKTEKPTINKFIKYMYILSSALQNKPKKKFSLCERRWLFFIATTLSSLLVLFVVPATLVPQMRLVAPCPPVSAPKHTPTTELSFCMQGGLDSSQLNFAAGKEKILSGRGGKKKKK